jgi:predicted DCC family thiol-disulfide oxidoreductase YuxK
MDRALSVTSRYAHFTGRKFCLFCSELSVIPETSETTDMRLSDRMERIEVFYDGRCGMCCSFHEWINRQPRAFPVEFIPYQAPHAEQVFPGLGMLDPAREMVVRTCGGGIFRGAEAWVWCLYSCANHQAVARRLARPRLLPVAVHACRVLASNRHALSKIFFRKKDRLVRNELHRMEPPKCNGEFCANQ